jgi:putative MATE family efflux protein
MSETRPAPRADAALAPLAREVAELAWPAIVQSLVATLVFLADRVMLGRYDTDALASMQISGPVLWSVLVIFTAFSSGTVAVVGRAVGAGDAERARKTVASVVGLALALGALVGAAGFFGRGAVARILTDAPGTTDVVRALAERYMGIAFASSPLAFAAIIGVTALQASGDTRTPLLASLLASAVKVGGNALLVFGAAGAPELGITGAAAATAAAFAAEAAVVLSVLLRRRRGARIALEPIDNAHAAALRSVLAVSAPAFAEKLLYHAGFLVFVGFVGRLGNAAMAANQALVAIESIGFMTAEGFGIASGAIVAQKLGAGRPREAARCGWLATGMSIALLCLASLAFLLAPRRLLGLFTSDASIIALGARCLVVAAVAQPLMAIADSLSAALRGAGDTRTPMRVALVGPVLVRLGATWVLAFALGWGLLGVWIGSTLDWLVRAVWLGFAFRRGRWKTIDV